MGISRRNAVAAADALRSELVFLTATGSATRVGDCVVILTPDNPTYWWGNTLAFDAPPANGDFERWHALFDAHVRSAVPGAEHTTFGWDGDERGVIAPFVQAGFDYFEMVVLAAEASTPIAAPHADPAIGVAPLSGKEWDALRDLLVDTRDPKHSAAGYATFAERRIAGWRALVEAGHGAWFGIWDPSSSSKRLLSSLGLFVEGTPGMDGRRIGRFQQVATRVEGRRRGLAGILVAHAARYGFASLAADTILIFADENDAAKRVYQSVGFMPHGWQRGLERGAK